MFKKVILYQTGEIWLFWKNAVNLTGTQVFFLKNPFKALNSCPHLL